MSEVEFLTVGEIAARMRVSKMTVYRLVETGELPSVRVGRSFRVRSAVLEQFLTANTKGAIPADVSADDAAA